MSQRAAKKWLDILSRSSQYWTAGSLQQWHCNLGYTSGLTDCVRGQCSRQVLLVGKDKQCSSCQALLHQQTLEFLLSVLHALVVGAVHYPHEVVGTLKVVLPVGPFGLPAASTPDVQFKSLVSGLDIEAQHWRAGVYVFSIEIFGFPSLEVPPLYHNPLHVQASPAHFVLPYVIVVDNLSPPIAVTTEVFCL